VKYLSWHASPVFVTASLVSLAACSQSGDIGDPSGPPPPAQTVIVPVEGEGVPKTEVLRTVETRNPFGVPAHNLMADGDFELSTSGGDGGQYGWRSFGNTGQSSLLTETGGLCRTGLRCGVLEPGSVLLGTGTAAPGGAGHQLTIHTKPKDASVSCPTVLNAYVLYCSSFNPLEALETDPERDESGWCRHHIEFPPGNRAPCVYLEAHHDALIDSAVLLPVGGVSKSTQKSAFVADQALLGRIERVQKWIRDSMPLADRPRALQLADGHAGP
jgi:hypothetical protein